MVVFDLIYYEVMNPPQSSWVSPELDWFICLDVFIIVFNPLHYQLAFGLSWQKTMVQKSTGQRDTIHTTQTYASYPAQSNLDSVNAKRYCCMVNAFPREYVSTSNGEKDCRQNRARTQ